VEAWLSQSGVPFTMRDVVQEPITREEFARLIRDPQGRVRVPFTCVGSATVLGFDPIRLQEYLDAEPGAPVVAHVRNGEVSSEQLLAHLETKAIPYAVREVDADPLSLEELWGLLTIPARGLRTPYTVIGDELVLGYDVPKLQRLLGDRLRAASEAAATS
jgi:arsenate reductase-like glutaredoxin family protein